MKSSSHHGWDPTPAKGRRITLFGALGVSIAVGALIATSPLLAEGTRHDTEQHGVAHRSHEASHHDDHHRGDGYANGGYGGGYGGGYMAPPVVYVPAQEPGISLVLPL